ncbi:hypothetical protein ACFU76_36220, partial [Streptomyces sp. NPDC057539]
LRQAVGEYPHDPQLASLIGELTMHSPQFATLGQERLSGSLTLSTGAPSGVYARYGTLLQSQLAREAPDLDITLRGWSFFSPGVTWA